MDTLGFWVSGLLLEVLGRLYPLIIVDFAIRSSLVKAFSDPYRTFLEHFHKTPMDAVESGG